MAVMEILACDWYKQQTISVKNDEHGSLAITILPRKGIGLVQNTFDVYRGSGS
jgi:hypothetical protein